MRRFFDSNVFLYAFLDQGSAKKAIAVQLIAEAVRKDNGWTSTQVVREFINVMIKKSSKSPDEIKMACCVFDHFKMVEDTLHLAFRGLEIKEKYGTQYFDSVLIAAAEKGLCEEFCSEDLSDGQVYCGIRVHNPFR